MAYHFKRPHLTFAAKEFIDPWRFDVSSRQHGEYVC